MQAQEQAIGPFFGGFVHTHLVKTSPAGGSLVEDTIEFATCLGWLFRFEEGAQFRFQASTCGTLHGGSAHDSGLVALQTCLRMSHRSRL